MPDNNLWAALKQFYEYGGVDSLVVKPTFTGQLLYVDPESGNTSAFGTKSSPLGGPGGLQAAIDRCIDDNGDVIIVNEGSHSVTQAVNFNKRGITVLAARLGLAPAPSGEKFMVNAASSYTDGPAAKITAPCIIAGLGFAARDLTKEALLFDAQSAGGFNAAFSLILNCRFPVWYGAIAAGIRVQGGTYNHIVGCTFDGLFGGFGTAGIICETSGAIDPSYFRVIGNYFDGLGSGKYAIKHTNKVLSYFYQKNHMLPGFLGNTGKFLDNNSTTSTGTASQNYFGGFADKAAVADNLVATNEFAGNFYDEV